MRYRSPEQGSLFLQLIVLLFILGSGTFFVMAWRRSRVIDRNETEAIAVLRDLARAEDEFATTADGFGALKRLLDLELREPGLGPARRSFRDERLEGAGLFDEVLIHEGYCFIVLLADASGLATPVESDDLDRSYYIAYAWPFEVDRTGRRVFSVDPGGQVRSWENRLPGEQSYSGPEEAPPARLAPATEGWKQPFSTKRQGPLKSLIWTVIPGGES